MPEVKLASALPDGDDNGLMAVHEKLCDDPHALHVIVGLVDCKRITTDMDDGSVVPTARVKRIEVIADTDDGKRLVQLIRRAYERRTGKVTLPLDLEDDLNAVFQHVDPNTGELRNDN